MCGIYGIVAIRDGYVPNSSALPRMGAAIVHRGPDDEGVYANGPVAIGMRRLSIIDLSGGHQPISNEDGTIWIVCNGEIYNFRTLSDALKKSGHRFRTASDTEVLVHLYEEHGLGMLDRLEGMYAFALWDAKRRRLVVARDRLGVKPVYFMRDRDRLVFGSEAKSILAAGGVSLDIDPPALNEYLALGYTPTDRSLFRDIEKLPPASVLVCEHGRVEISRYWTLDHSAAPEMSERDWAAELRSRIEKAVAAEMVSDVPLGAFLSGGLDSSTVVAMMARHSSLPVNTYSIGFDTGSAGAYYNELPFASAVARLFKTRHKEILVRPDVARLVPKLLWHMDEPIADSAFVTTYLVAEFARKDVTVILSGVGGDEVFGGYRRYLGDHYGEIYRRLPEWVRRSVIQPLAGLLPSDRHSPLTNLGRYAKTFVRTSDMPAEERYRSYVQVFGQKAIHELIRGLKNGHRDSLAQAFAAISVDDPVNRMMAIDIATQLPNDLLMLTDKMTMAASIECRVPLLNHTLVEFAASMPASLKIRSGRLKHVLKVAIEGILPPEIINRKKRGFGAPMGAWLKHEMAPLMRSVLSRDSVARRGLFDWRVIDRTIGEHHSGREDHTDSLLALVNFEIWARIFLDRRAHEDVASELREVVPA